MAVGFVKTDSFHTPGSNCHDLVARSCGLTGKYGMLCARYDPHTGETLVCPYWNGMRIYGDDRYMGECRTPREASEWFATHELSVVRRYHVLCLAPEAPPAVPGATFPR